MKRSNIEVKTFNYRNTIITFKAEIRSTEVETYLKRHLNDFYKNSRFTILCGVHTSPTGELSCSDSKFVADYQSMFDNIISDYENKCEKKCDHCQQCQKFLQWEKKQFHMGTVMPIFSKVNIEGKYVLLKSSVNSIKKTFEDLIKTEEPHIFVFATCFSHYSEINHLLYSCGLFSALTISKEHGDITCGKIFKLNEEQKSLLKEVTRNYNIKDNIFGGKCSFRKFYIYNISNQVP